jgi:type IV secretion system protein VirD4
MQGRVTNERAPGTFTLVPVAIFCVATLSGWWYATQGLASALGHQAQLGAPMFYLWGTPVYRPWQVMSWNYWFHAYAPDEFNAAMKLVFASMGAAVAMVIIYAVWVARRSMVATTYGTARWGTKDDIEQAGLAAKTGVVVGLRDDGTYLIHDGPENVGLVAPPRSGKGAGPIVSTLLVWEHSAVINDIRRENFDATAGYRAKFSNVIYFNPTDPTSAHFNPLFEIRKGPSAIGDAQNVADIIVDPDGTGRPTHWDKTSHSLLRWCA